uniref:Photoreceptor cilium actin regulator 2 n=1 Tax=Cyprinus carpio TaxID=7962 RepID=A0A8C1LH57_CYPCA
MGCSPSKGQLFSKKAILSESPENKKNSDLLSDGAQLLIKADISTASEGLAATEIQENEKYVQGKRSSVVDVVCDATVTVKEDATEHMLDEVRIQDGQSAQEGLSGNRKGGTEETNIKHGKRRKQRKYRLRKNSYAQSKAEFILKAHQAAYAYLNPSISKYESLLGLLSQAAHTHLSVQTTVASVVLHYEEINQALEEMASEGEQLLREHGHNMTWPALLKDYPPTTTKPSNELNFSQLPSELLQQMLLHSTAKMISVGDSVKCLSDSALQELAEYYGSLSQILGEKLLAKHAAEKRLKQVLSRVEAAALRKTSPEDSALHSEDSGIGADNECQNGSERLRRNRGSSGSGANTGITSVLTSSPDQPFLNANEEVTDNDDDDDDDDDNDDYEEEDADVENEISGKDEQGGLTDQTRGTMCGSSEPESTHPSVQGSFQKQEQVKTGNLKRKTRRPKTADSTFQVKLKYRHLRGPKRSQSAECLCSKAEGSDPNQQQENPRNKQTPRWRRKNNLPEESVHGGHVWTKIRKSLSGGQCAARYYGLQYGSKGPFRAIPPSSPPKFTPEPPGRNAVKRLINTFNQGVEDNSRQSPLDQKPIRVRGNKKCTLPLLQNSRGALTTNGNIKSSIHPLEPRPEQLDIDSLPPPPPEMLMDNSFESSLGLPTEDGAHDLQCRGQRLRTSMQRETVLPNRGSVQRGSMSFSATQPLRQDALPGSSTEQEYKKVTELDSEREAAHTLDQKFRKVVHLPADSSAKTAPANAGMHGSMPYQECENHNEGETASMQAKTFPPTTPPVSRARLPPSCPTVRHAVPSPPSTACPPSTKWSPSTTSVTSSIHRCAMAEENSLHASGTQSFCEARAVFCKESKSLPHTLTHSCTSTLPRPWGEPARGRPTTTRLQPSFMGRSPSGQRSSHSEQPQLLPNAKQQQGQGNDVTPLTSEGTTTASMRADDSGTDSEPSTADLI